MIGHLLNGFVYGGLLYVLSVGLVLIFGLRRVVNFAHGNVYMIGAYIGFSIASLTGSLLVGGIVSIAVMAVIGALLDTAVFRPLQKHDPLVTVLVTFGMLLVLEDLATTIWGKDHISVPVPTALQGTVRIFGESFPVYRLFVIAVAVAVAIALSLWLRLSRIGLFVRACSVDAQTTAIQGVNTDRVSITVVAIGTALAGLSGTIAAPLLALSPTMGNLILIDSFIVVVVGGLGSFSGAFLAAIVIGQIHNYGLIYVPWAATMIPFLLMVGILIWRPQGIAGTHT